MLLASFRRSALRSFRKFSTTHIRHAVAQPSAVFARAVPMIEPAFLASLVPGVRCSTDART